MKLIGEKIERDAKHLKKNEPFSLGYFRTIVKVLFFILGYF